jgi:hypothetical protein
MPMTVKVDLHVHSKHSNQPTEWYLRRFAAPESYTEPREVYRLARERGMDFVTISDHDSIAGALEIAHLPGTFLSSEITTFFPENGCEVHVLAFGISEVQHGEIQRLRPSIYELRDYLRAEAIACSVAHPLFRVNGRLTLDQLEKLLVLFDRFEALNGMHERRANELTRSILQSLSRRTIEELALRHRLEPWGERPWEKGLTGGTDDHGGYYVATTFTRTPPAATVPELLEHLRQGRCEPGGESGSSLRLAQSVYGISYELFRRTFPALLGNRKDPFAELLRALAEGPAPRRAERRPSTRALLWLRERMRGPKGEGRAPRRPPADRFILRRVGRLSRDAFSRLLARALRQARRGRLAAAVGELSHLVPLALTLAPHLASIRSLHKDGDLLETAGRRFVGSALYGGADLHPRRGRAWVTDAALAPGGVVEMGERLRILSRLPGASEVAVLLADKAAGRRRSPWVIFEPVAEVALPDELGGGRVAVPHLLELLDHCERAGYAEIVVDTPGPAGVAGLAVGKLLGLRTTAVYDTDLPRRLRATTDSATLEGLAWAYLRWFFGAFDTVYAASHHERDSLLAQGLDAGRVELLPAAWQPQEQEPRQAVASSGGSSSLGSAGAAAAPVPALVALEFGA